MKTLQLCSPFFSFFLCYFRRWYWDLLMVFLMAVTLLLVPINIAFFSDQFVPWFAAVNCVFDAFFIIDIILNFFTGYLIATHDQVNTKYFLSVLFLFSLRKKKPDFFVLELSITACGCKLLYIHNHKSISQQIYSNFAVFFINIPDESGVERVGYTASRPRDN